MKRLICAAGMATALLMTATTAMAQTAGTPVPASSTQMTGATMPAAGAPSVNMGYIGGFAGIGAVKNVSPIIGGEVGVRVYHGLDVIAEGAWMKDGVSRRRSDLAASLATLIQTQQGKPATSAVEAPVFFGLVGLRYMIDINSALHPYVIGDIGRASIEYKPTFSLNGSDITGTLPAYGVTLGSDIASKEAKTALGGGVGFWYVSGPLFVDGSVRLLHIQTSGQATNITRAHVGVGIRF